MGVGAQFRHSNRGQGHEAEIDQMCGNGQIVLKRSETAKRFGLAQRDKTIQRDRADNTMERDPSRFKPARSSMTRTMRGNRTSGGCRGCAATQHAKTVTPAEQADIFGPTVANGA